MDTLTIELTNPRALSLLTEITELQLIRFVKTESIPKSKLSSLLRG